MDRNKKALLIGLILGDGHLNPRHGVALEIEHGHKQESYIEYKRNLIGRLLNCNPPNVYHNKTKDTYKISKGHRYFRILYNGIYKNGTKKYTYKLLSYLNPQAIAIGWMDDGCHSICRRKSSGKIMSHKFEGAIYTDEIGTQEIINYFDTVWNVHFYPIGKTMKDGTKKAKLQCRTREGRKFCDIIRPFILPEFEYKILKPGE